ncbi:MAG: DUF1365 domain-containing protein [Xanthomonadales bacterium]|nr:DUF1365 domain-containing protein [Xanthomonadales bacterium]
MSQVRHSAIYEGWVRHRRHEGRAHAFRYRLAMLYLDLAELPDLFSGTRLWSLGRGRPAQFRRSDYLSPGELPLAEAVRNRVAAELGERPAGPVRMLAHARYFGLCFNPVTFYYCFTDDGAGLVAIVAEITNTPWNERHVEVLDCRGAAGQGRALHFRFPKRFHVSPFLPMDRRYHWSFEPPGDELRVHMDVLRDDGRSFDATLVLERREASPGALDRLVWRFPLMTARVLLAIYWQALRLWLKGNRFHPHPRHSTQDGNR